MEVRFGQFFTQHFKNFPKADQIKIADFVSYVQTYGLDGLLGRNKPSHEVPTDNPNWSERVAYAQKYKLWHYHIGIPYYIQSVQGDYVSEYILHYIRENDHIILVDMTPHPPFELPKEDYLI